MIDKTEEKFLCIIKDFNKPALNGNIYNLDADCTKFAIIKLLERKEIFGELNHPTPGDLSQDDFMKRLNQVNMENAVVHISELDYDEDKKQLIGIVKKIGNNFPKLFEKLHNNEVRFGMRSLCHHYRTGDETKIDVVEIITFDIINGDTSTQIKPE